LPLSTAGPFVDTVIVPMVRYLLLFLGLGGQGKGGGAIHIFRQVRCDRAVS